MTTRRSLLKTAVALAPSVLLGVPKAPPPGGMKAFCIDFNWHHNDENDHWINSFAAPGHWADADPQQHVDWYAGIGANVIQTFCVSCNGYAWYKGGAVTPQPGLKFDFLTDVVRLGHRNNMLVTGYFCAGANTKFAQDHPSLSYGTPSTLHIPFTDEYLDYLSRSISDAVRRTGIDGFMIDWIWNPAAKLREKGWIEAEKKLYAQIMGKPLPAVPDAAGVLQYERKAIERCWRTVHQAAKSVRKDCVVWLSCSRLMDPTVVGAAWLKEVDWVMNENSDRAHFESARKAVGPRTRMLQCLAGWQSHDAATYLSDATTKGIDLYGFAEPRDNSLPLPAGEYLSRGPAGFPGKDRLSTNDRNTASLARFYNGRSLK